MCYAWMIKMKDIQHFLLSLKVCNVVGDESLELDDHVLWPKFIWLIVVIFGVKYVCKILNDHYEPSHSDMSEYWHGHNLGI